MPPQPVDPGSGDLFAPPNNLFGGPEVELLIDGKKAMLVQGLVLSVNAHDMLPTLFLKLIPGELDIEIDTEAAYAAALAEMKSAFVHGLDGSFAPNPLFVPTDGPPGAAPLPPLTPEQIDELQAEWNRQFKPDPNLTAEQLAEWMKGKAPGGDAKAVADQMGQVLGKDIFGRRLGAFVEPPPGQPCPGAPCCGQPEKCGAGAGQAKVDVTAAFKALDHLVNQGHHGRPVVLRVQDGKIVAGTLEEYDRKAKDPLPKPVG